ncbi:MAG TPA: ABC transporter transmembrane domain-containing protein, partial [Candidatus Eisenbacteria bacterium]|nr:ABC transporter transmembrane domain-containing protein [Candidatus Eisenbacteria bacterium]
MLQGSHPPCPPGSAPRGSHPDLRGVRAHPNPRGSRRRLGRAATRTRTRRETNIQVLRHLLPYLRRHKIALVLGALSVLLTNLFGVLAPWLVRQAIDHLQAGVTSAALVRDAGLILAAVLAQGIFMFLMRMTLIRASRTMEYELRNDLFGHVARLPAATYRRWK